MRKSAIPGSSAGHVAILDELVSALCGLEHGIGAVALHDRQGGPPDFDFGK